ncbi:hypothetical protein [Alishewanella longhuensis]
MVTILHREIKALPEPMLDLLALYIGNIVVGNSTKQAFEQQVRQFESTYPGNRQNFQRSTRKL